MGTRKKRRSINVLQRSFAPICIGLLTSSCVSQNTSYLEDLGFNPAPYLDIAAEDQIDPLISSAEASTFHLSGKCGSKGSTIEISIPDFPETLPWSTPCSEEGIWEISLDLSAVPDGKFQFEFSHTRLGTDRTTVYKSNSFKKITQPPSSPSSSNAPGAVNNASPSTGRIIVSWPTAYDAAGDPLVEYQIALGIGSPTQYTPEGWVSVGGLTHAEILVPSNLPEGSDIYVSILGFDQTGASATQPAVSEPIRIDQTPPTIVGPINASVGSTASTQESPVFTWSTSGWSLSDIATLEYRIFNTTTQQEVRGWSSNSVINPPHSVSGLSLTAGQTYRYDVRARDAAGNVTSNILSASWSVTSPASTPQLVFATPPSANGVLNLNLATQPVIEARDPSGNVVTSLTGSITLSAHTDSNCSNAASVTLSAFSGNLASGVATLSGLSMNGAPGTVYLKATASGSLPVCSSAITLTGVLAFMATPSNAVISTNFPQFSVALQNGTGQGIGGASATVSLVPYPSGDTTCSGTSAPGALTNASVIASSGTATFTQVQYDRSEGIRLKAAAAGYAGACSPVITVGSGTNPVPSISTNPLAWFKADSITGLSNGANVTTWSDSSGNNRSAGNGTAPTYQAAVIGGKPALRFGSSA